MSLKANLDFIRQVLDEDTTHNDIDAVHTKLHCLIQLQGLAGEMKAEAKKELADATLVAIHELQQMNAKLTPTILLKMAEAKCSQQLKTYTYADRLCAGISHGIEGLRSILSYRKEEMAKALWEPSNQSKTHTKN
jgi:hypothetical protein